MKKLIFLICMMLATTLTFAQEIRRVAILEVVDKQGDVSYANKLILRSSLAKAITNTPGYEAYDRTDMDAIMGEQNFQRTGMVSNDQIKRLGEMTGAKYVLVAEAVLVDEQNMYITAKLLDVETARTEITDNQMMGTTAKEIQEGCQLLAANLIESKNVPNTSTSQLHSASNEQKKVVPLSQIVKVGINKYTMNGKVMDNRAYEKFLQKNCPDTWSIYKKGKTEIIAGWSILGAGTALAIIGGAIAGVTNTNTGAWAFGISGISIGSAGWAAGVVSFSVGYYKKAYALKIYNEECATQNNYVSLNLTTGQDGLGIALNF